MVTSLSSDPCKARTGLEFLHLSENSEMARCVTVNVLLLDSQQAAPSTMPIRIFCENASMPDSRTLCSPGRYMTRLWVRAKNRQALFFVLYILFKTLKKPCSGKPFCNLRILAQPSGGFLDCIYVPYIFLKQPPSLPGCQRSFTTRHDDPVFG